MGSSQDTNKQETSTPLAAQMGYLSQGFQGASDAMAKAGNAPTPTGFTAQMTPEQLATFRQMVGYNSAAPGMEASTGAGLASGGANAMSQAFNGLQNFKQTGNVDSTIADASRYADNPAISGMVGAAMRDATQTARDVTLPGIEQGAAATGNTNSSRTGIAQGLVERGLAQKAADVSANLRGQAYDTGLGLANNQNQFATNTNRGILSDLTAAGGAGAGLGLGALSNSIGDQKNVFGTNVVGGAGLQAADQANLTNQNQAYQFGVNSPFAPLNNFWNIVGSKNWGSNTTGNSTTQNNPGALQYAGLGLNALGMFMPSGGFGAGQSTGNAFLPSSSFLDHGFGFG
jgi:hypothetical protein